MSLPQPPVPTNITSDCKQKSLTSHSRAPQRSAMQPQSRGSAHSPQGPPGTLSSLDLDTPDRGDRDQQLTTWSFRGP